MADVATAYVRLRPNTQGFQGEAQSQIESQLAGVTRGLRNTVGLALAGFGIEKTVSSIIEAATGRQQALSQVEQTVKNAGASWKVYGKTVEDVLDEQENRTGFDFEELAQGFGRLEQQIRNTPRALEILQTAEDVARARHLDLAQVTVALGRAYAGNTQSLSRLGIVIPKYTENLDRVKQRHTDLIVAGYKLSAAQKAQYADAVKAAQAADKQAGATNALAEVQRRYGGQANVYAQTAAGSFARFHVAVQQLEEEIGNQFLPELTKAANAGAKFGLELANNEDVAHGFATAAGLIGSTVESLVGGLEAVAPLLRIVADGAKAIGPEPIIAFIAAWKLLPPVLALANASISTTATEFAATQAQLALMSAQTEVLSAQLNVLTASEEEAAVAAAYLASAQDVVTLAEGEAAAAAEALAIAEAGAGAGMLGMLGPAALVAGGLVLLATHFGGADDAAKHFKTTINDLTDSLAASNTDVRGARIARDQAQNQAVIARVARDAARDKAAADARGSASAATLSADLQDVTTKTIAARAATHTYAQSQDDLAAAIAKQRRGAEDYASNLASLTTQVVALGRQTQITKAGGLGTADSFRAERVERFASGLERLAAQNPKLESQLRDLAGIARATHQIPDSKTISIVLNPKLDASSFFAQVADAVDKGTEIAKGAFTQATEDFLGRGGLKAIKPPTGADFAKLYQNLPDDPIPKAKTKKAGKKAAESFTDGFVQDIDLGAIADALTNAVEQARSNLSSTSSALADQVGSALDARLAATEKRIDAADQAIRARISARDAAAQARNQTSAADDAALKLKQLQDVLGGGPLTADQTQALQQAKNAVLDSQDAIANAQDQAESDALAAKKQTLEQQNELEKTASSRRIADLTDELNRGLITQAQYVKGVRGLLDKEQVSYKTSGALLGRAFADGFADSLKGVIDQARALGLVGVSTLRKQTTAPKAVSPRAEEAAATKSIVDQIAQSGGRFSFSNIGKLPPGLNVAGLLSAAGAEKRESSYREKSTKQQDDVIHYVGRTADHTKAILDEMKKANAKAPVVVVDDSKKKAKHAQATR